MIDRNLGILIPLRDHVSAADEPQAGSQCDPPARSEIPQTVMQQIKHQIATLEALTIARQTDASFNGQGRYEAEAYLNRKSEIETAWKRIDEFEAQCAKRGVDPATVYAEIGQPARLSDAAKEWVADFSRNAITVR
jgi:hypothetical protein